MIKPDYWSSDDILYIVLEMMTLLIYADPCINCFYHKISVHCTPQIYFKDVDLLLLYNDSVKHRDHIHSWNSLVAGAYNMLSVFPS